MNANYEVLFFATFNVALSAHLFGNSLSVNISLHKTSIVLGEPLYITAHVENKESYPVSIIYGNSPSFDNGEGWGRVMISQDATGFSEWSDDIRVLGKMASAWIRPHSGLDEAYVVCASGFWGDSIIPAFPAPGKYGIKLEYVLLSGDVAASEPVELEVKAPPSKENPAWSLLRSNRLYWLLVQAPWEVKNTDTSIDFDKEMKLVKDSVYGQYMALGIARSLLHSGNRTDALHFLQYCATASDNEFIIRMVKKLKMSYLLI